MKTTDLHCISVTLLFLSGLMGITFGKGPFSCIALIIRTGMCNPFSATCRVAELHMTSRANHLDRFAIFSSLECSETELEMNSGISDY